MTKKNWLLVFTALALAGVYIFFFTDAFKPKIIHITSINARVIRARNRNADLPTVPVLFKLSRPFKLTEIKVVALDEWQTNKNCLPLWHLIADTNPAPLKVPFAYGQKITGMKPDVPGAHAQLLQPGVKYRLFITAGSAKGEHDFQPAAIPGTASP